MFIATYRSTLKTLLRSAILWAAIVIIFILVVRNAFEVHYSRTLLDEEYNIIGHATDYDPEFEMTYSDYLQVVRNNVMATLMNYLMPLFAVISTVLVLTREHKDGFFEIEKAGGVKTQSYFFGRICAVVTVNVAVALAAVFTSTFVYSASRHIISRVGFTLFGYIGETSLRLLLMFFTSAFHGILFYIALTYMVGNLMKGSMSGAIAGCGYILFLRVCMYNVHFRMTYFYSLLLPDPDDIYLYWNYVGLDGYLDNIYGYRAWPFFEVLLRTGLVYVIVTAMFIVAYISVRKRKV